jgi:hypothetical protein
MARHGQRIAHEEGPREPRRVARQLPRGALQRGVDDQVHRQAAVVHRVRVALHVARVVGIVVDAVGVPGDRGVAEDQRRGEHELVRPGGVGRRRGRRRGGALLAGRDGLAVDRVEFVHRDGLAARLDGLPQGEDGDLASARLLRRDRHHLGGLPRGFAGVQPAHDPHPPSRAHPPRQRDRRQHDTRPGVAVRPDVGLAEDGAEEDREPVRRQGRADPERLGIEVEHARGAAHRGQADLVLHDPLAADPVALDGGDRRIEIAL